MSEDLPEVMREALRRTELPYHPDDAESTLGALWADADVRAALLEGMGLPVPEQEPTRSGNEIAIRAHAKTR